MEADVGGVADFEKVIEKLKEINTNYLDKSKETNIELRFFWSAACIKMVFEAVLK